MRPLTWLAAVAVLASATPSRLAPARGEAAAPPPESSGPPPALLARADEDSASEPLALAKCEVYARIDGFLAETTTTLTFRNDLDRVLEGELVFPLPEGATVSGYGLDLEGEIVDAVPVERRAARLVFETEVRKGVDPGLAEWVKGNNFRVRVYPIPARGTRTVRVRYVSDLETRGVGERAAFYSLPLRFEKSVGEIVVEVEVVQPATVPEIRAGSLSGLSFEPWKNVYVARAVLREARPREDLLIALPAIPTRFVRVEKGEAGEHYFVIDDFPPVPPAAAGRAPERIGLAWDASFSRLQADLGRELALLEALLKRLSDVDVELTAFRDVPEEPQTFRIRGGRAEALLAHLRALPYDGGTRLDALPFSADAAYHLLFSDGLGSLGRETPGQAGAPVYAISSDARANHALLRHVAETSGGAYFNLVRLADEQVLAWVGIPAFSFLSAQAEEGAVADLHPSRAQPVHGRFTLAGRLLAPTARLVVRYGAAGQPAVTRTFELQQSQAAPGLGAQAWAQKRADELSVFPETHREELLRLGRRFGIVTPRTSLLVLETLEQHLEHDVEPPATRPALQAEYRRLAPEHRAGASGSRQEKLERVAEMWAKRVAWWEKEYRYDPSDLAKIARDAQAVRGAEQAVLAPPPPPSGTAETVTVTAEAAPPALFVAAMRVELPPAGPTISIKPWDPATPYLRAIQAAGKRGSYAAYLSERDRHGGRPAFFLDAADVFFRQGQRALARRVVTSILDLRLEEPQLLRVAAHKLAQEDELDLAVELFQQARRLRPEEPQSHRDLALALAARADRARAASGRIDEAASADYRKAIGLLDEVVRGGWDHRFPEIEVTALIDANRILVILERANALDGYAIPIDPRLRKLLDLDVRIVLTWDTDQTDMDLWVIEPSGEKCFYGHELTTTGGMISEDFTAGYGPEEYLVRRALVGDYRIEANFYGSRAPTLTGPTTVQATVITHFGRPTEKRRALRLRLTEKPEKEADEEADEEGDDESDPDTVEVGVIRFAR